MDLTALKARIAQGLSSITSAEDLKEARVSLLGRKGLFSECYEKLKSLDKEEKKAAGQELNALKGEVEAALGTKEAAFAEEDRRRRERASSIDITLPGKKPMLGRKHPLTMALDRIIAIFSSLGFKVAEGPDVELDYYNFEALNMPKDHPARDMQDTFYIKPGVVLRTQTSPMQIRTMERELPPIRVIAPGSVYRHDQDISHTPMFHQVEGFMVDRNVRFSDLKGILTIFVKEMFGENVPVRFRPSYFPFTEPSAEVDIECVICGGSGCRTCSFSGWLEILGSGMLDPELYRFVNYDADKYTGFAFGLGIERVAMLKFGIPDIRLFYENDIRFLNQF